MNRLEKKGELYMSTYREIALKDFISAKSCLDIGDYRIAVYTISAVCREGCKNTISYKGSYDRF